MLIDNGYTHYESDRLDNQIRYFEFLSNGIVLVRRCLGSRCLRSPMGKRSPTCLRSLRVASSSRRGGSCLLLLHSPKKVADNSYILLRLILHSQVRASLQDGQFRAGDLALKEGKESESGAWARTDVEIAVRVRMATSSDRIILGGLLYVNQRADAQVS